MAERTAAMATHEDIPSPATEDSPGGLLTERPNLADISMEGVRGAWMGKKVSDIKVFGRRLLGARSGGAAWSDGTGGAFIYPSPNVSSPYMTLSPELLRRMSPSSMRRDETWLDVGDEMPDFEVHSSDGQLVRRSDFGGRPYAIRLTRTFGSGSL